MKHTYSSSTVFLTVAIVKFKCEAKLPDKGKEREGHLHGGY